METTKKSKVLAVKRGFVAYAIGAMLFGMVSAGSALADPGTVTVPELDVSDITLDLTPVKDVYNMTISASLGIAGFRKAGVAAKKW